MDVHPTKNSINKYWSIPIYSHKPLWLGMVLFCQLWLDFHSWISSLNHWIVSAAPVHLEHWDQSEAPALKIYSQWVISPCNRPPTYLKETNINSISNAFAIRKQAVPKSRGDARRYLLMKLQGTKGSVPEWLAARRVGPFPLANLLTNVWTT